MRSATTMPVRRTSARRSCTQVEQKPRSKNAQPQTSAPLPSEDVRDRLGLSGASMDCLASINAPACVVFAPLCLLFNATLPKSVIQSRRSKRPTVRGSPELVFHNYELRETQTIPTRLRQNDAVQARAILQLGRPYDRHHDIGGCRREGREEFHLNAGAADFGGLTRSSLDLVTVPERLVREGELHRIIPAGQANLPCGG